MAGEGTGASRRQRGRPRRRRGGGGGRKRKRVMMRRLTLVDVGGGGQALTLGGARWERRASATPTPATTQHAPPMPGGPSRVADADDDDELSRLLSLAEANLDAGHLRAAHKHAPRTTHLDPDSPRGSLLLTAIFVLVADHSFHRATLLLPDSDSQGSPLSPSALRRHYKSLSKSLRSCSLSSSPVVFSTIKEALRRVANAYAAPALVRVSVDFSSAVVGDGGAVPPGLAPVAILRAV
uniref:Uncharacterized protein n=1 Tax=Oryza glumipatula TaxID=40148 RepID=A0A0E0B052_9ORYZ